MARKYETALVTGASSGMGREIAQRLLRDGYTVYVAARGVDKMSDLANAGATVLGMDLSKEDEIEAAVERILADGGGIDILVNNAGYGQYGPVEDTPLDTARYQFEVNLFGPARLTQLLLPTMRERRKGLIINISSVGGKIFTPLGAWYHATKHALEGWSDCLRLELGDFGIHVVVIEPGIIRTGFGDRLSQNFVTKEGSAYSGLSDRMQKANRSTYASRRASPPGVVADAVMKAIGSERPRTRYAVGSMAKPLIFLRSVVSDRMFERIIMSQIR